MQIVLVGLPKARERLRRALSSLPIVVVDEVETVAQARLVTEHVDGFFVAAPDAGAVGGDDTPAPETLTAREIDVMELLAEGLSNKAIALRLHISDQTVKFHVAQICGKLGAANRTDAVRLAVRRGLVTI